MYRSMLFVPGDSERKIAKSRTVAPDAIILDLEDAVAPPNKPRAREIVAAHLAEAASGAARWVRINPLDSGHALADLTAVMAGAPAGILLPKCRSAADVVRLGDYLDALEAQHGIAIGTTRIIPVATEMPEAMFALGSYAQAGQRLAGITWGAEDLAAAIGAIDNKDDDGGWSAPFRLARSLCLFAALAAGVAALDTLYADFRDAVGLAASTRQARRDGFTGRVAIHPDQVAIINTAFSPVPALAARTGVMP